MKTTEDQARPSKPSGIPWLGEVPAHWVVKRLKYLATTNDEALPETADPTQEIVYVEIGGVDAVEGIVAKQQLVLEDAPSRARRLVRHGDTVVSTVRTYLRAIAAIRDPEPNLVVSTGFAVIRPRELDPDYLGYALRSPLFIETIVSRSTGVSYPGINASEIGNIEVAYPPLPEQRAIAAFLDERTARIDALVARKRRLVQLLKEKRQALITRAVTRGLNPKAKMKESGVPWLGEVPEGWALRPLKQLVSEPITDGPHETPEFVDEGVPFVSAEAVWDGTIHMESIRGYITREDHERYARKYLPRRNDIYMVKSGSTTGRVAIVDFDTEFNIWSPLAAIRCNEVLAHHRFIYHAMTSDYFQKQVQTRWSFGTQPNIGMGVIGNLVIALPDRSLQKALCEYIDKGVARLDALVTKVEQAVERLQEYRTALISAAVTGKVRVPH